MFIKRFWRSVFILLAAFVDYGMTGFSAPALAAHGPVPDDEATPALEDMPASGEKRFGSRLGDSARSDPASAE